MKHPRESVIQRDIELALGAEPDLILLRNSVGRAMHVQARTGTACYVPYGLGVGTPDLVGMLTIAAPSGPVATWFCLEIKAHGQHARPGQRKCIELWRQYGAFVQVVQSVIEARAALQDARAALQWMLS